MIAVGRFPQGAKAGPEKALWDHFAGRSQWPVTLREVEEKRKLSGDQLKSREAELLLAQVPDGAAVIALDERGKERSSRQIAERIGAWRDDGIRDLAFIIGGADGLAPSVRERADICLGLGRMTWPHMLVRGLIAEQIFRAQCILSGHPYHRD